MLGIATLQRYYLNLTAPDGQSINWGWHRCRKEFLKKTGKVCVCCGTERQIQVHHKVPRHIGPDLAVDFTNLIALCKRCHFTIGHLGSYFTYNAAVELCCWFVHNNRKLELNRKDNDGKETE